MTIWLVIGVGGLLFWMITQPQFIYSKSVTATKENSVTEKGVSVRFAGIKKRPRTFFHPKHHNYIEGDWKTTVVSPEPVIVKNSLGFLEEEPSQKEITSVGATLRITHGGKVKTLTAHAGCKSYEGELTLQGQNVKIEMRYAVKNPNGLETKEWSDCDADPDQYRAFEILFEDAISGVKSFDVKEGQLFLFSILDDPLFEWKRFSDRLYGVGDTPVNSAQMVAHGHQQDSDSMEGYWMAAFLKGVDDEVFRNGIVSLNVYRGDSVYEIKGRSGCRRYEGQITLSEYEITDFHYTNENTNCKAVPQWQMIEDAFHQMSSDVRQYRLEDDQLVLSDDSGETLMILERYQNGCPIPTRRGSGSAVMDRRRSEGQSGYVPGHRGVSSSMEGTFQSTTEATVTK